jgi:hypothetical protein
VLRLALSAGRNGNRDEIIASDRSVGEGGADGVLKRRHFAAEVLSLVKGYGGLEPDQARRMKNLEGEIIWASRVWLPVSHLRRGYSRTLRQATCEPERRQQR